MTRVWLDSLDLKKNVVGDVTDLKEIIMETHFRYEVLKMSLSVEEMLSRILFIQFRISKEDSKTLSHKSSALSFKNKADLLLDLSKISKNTHKELQCFMEVRNQFMHNLSSSNILIAADRIEKKSYLISLSEEAKNAFEKDMPESLKIKALEISFMNLYGSIINAISNIGDTLQKDIEKEIDTAVKIDQAETMNEVYKLLGESVDAVSDKFDTVFGLEAESKKGVLKEAIFSHLLESLSKKYIKGHSGNT